MSNNEPTSVRDVVAIFIVCCTLFCISVVVAQCNERVAATKAERMNRPFKHIEYMIPKHVPTVHKEAPDAPEEEGS